MNTEKARSPYGVVALGPVKEVIIAIVMCVFSVIHMTAA